MITFNPYFYFWIERRCSVAYNAMGKYKNISIGVETSSKVIGYFVCNDFGEVFCSKDAVVIAGSAMDASEGSSSIADSCTGDLLFYTEGINVWNKNNSIMPNGSGLMGGISSIQPAIIIPSRSNANQYYVFTTNHTTGFRYSIVDMSLAGGLGDVLTGSKNTLLDASTSEGVTATMHSNCKDIWVVSHDKTLQEFRVNRGKRGGGGEGKKGQDEKRRKERKKREVFFFKQKTAYEIYQCDWSSDVCSSDLLK